MSEHAASFQHGSKSPASVGSSRAFAFPCRHGLHMRVAARIVMLANRFSCTLWMVSGSRRANAKSIISLMELGAVQGESVRITAEGAQAEEALAALTRLFETEALLCASAAPAPPAGADEDA